MIGETLNKRYRIEERLGAGSQAEVFRAHDRHMERPVAIKVWDPEGGFTVEEFLREATLLARFGAPHFVTIHEHSATPDKRPFLVLEYLQGESLENLSTPLSPRELRRFVRDVCVGLQKAHDGGIVHRDLKPGNVMLVDRGTRLERFVILDLGIAKIVSADLWRRTLTTATLAGAGTLMYMSPEQCSGGSIDARTDVYAFGCLLFYLLAGAEPFGHKSTNAIAAMAAILNDPPPRLSDVRTNVAFPEELERLVQDCLAKSPDARPASMIEVEERFARAMDEREVPSVFIAAQAARRAGSAAPPESIVPEPSAVPDRQAAPAARSSAVLPPAPETRPPGRQTVPTGPHADSDRPRRARPGYTPAQPWRQWRQQIWMILLILAILGLSLGILLSLEGKRRDVPRPPREDNAASGARPTADGAGDRAGPQPARPGAARR